MPNPSVLARLRGRAVAIWRGGRRKLDRLADLLLAPIDDAYGEALEAGDPAPIFCARTTPAAPAQLTAADRSLRREVADLRRELETLRSQSNFRADSLAAGLSVVFGHSQDHRNAAAKLQAEVNNVRNAQRVYQSRNEAFRVQAIKTLRESSQIFAVIGDDMRDLTGRIETIRAETKAAPSVFDAQTSQDVEDLLRRMREMEVLFSARTNLLGTPSPN